MSITYGNFVARHKRKLLYMTLIAFIYANVILFAMSVAPIFMKNLSGILTGYQVAFVVSFMTFIVSGIVLAFQNNLISTVKEALEYKVLFFAFLIGFLAFLDLFAYAIALQKGASVGVLLGYVRVGGTILTAILGYYIFKEKLDWIQTIGIAVSCIGLFLVLYKWK